MIRGAFAWTICFSCWLLLSVGLLLWARSDLPAIPTTGLQTGPGGLAIGSMYALVWMEVSAVGALIASRQPRNPIGWLVMAASLLASVQALTNGYVAWAPSIAGRGVLAWVGSWVGGPVLGLIVIALLAFPTGHLRLPWSRRVAWLAAVAALGQSVGFALQPGPLRGLQAIDNPIPIGGAGPAVLLARDLGTVALVLSMLACAMLLAVRLRRARGKERQQLKWIAYAAVLFAVGVGALGFAPPAATAWAAALFALTGAGMTTAVGVAIMRYQLFDIDVLINRSLIYGTLVVTLGAAYAAGVLLLQLLLAPFTHGSDLAIAASTLGVAALFGPAQRRIREGIDRRFYRRRYDAVRTLEAFNARLRDDVDLDSLTADLLSTVEQTMQPTHVSIWLRPT